MSSEEKARTGRRRAITTGPPVTPNRLPGTMQSVATADPQDFLNPNQWTVFSWAHQMVQELVMKESPYRTKLLDLAQHSMTRKMRGQTLNQFTPDCVVAAAWLSISFLWADPSTDKNLWEDASCAYTSMGNAGKVHFPIIAFSSAFKANDSPSGQQVPNRLTMDQAKTLLLFFRKLKHEFLHVVHRFVEIKYTQSFRKGGTPEKYTPNKQSIGRRKAVAEVGDHDEEEDSGGPILPLKFNQKLSSTNPLCLYFQHKYLPLSDKQVLGLLELGLYSVPVPDGPHNSLLTPFSIYQCRAVARDVLNAEFYVGTGTAPPIYAARAASRQRSLSRSSSPATSLETDDTDDTAELEAWRRNGNVPIQVPENFFLLDEQQQQAK